MNNKTIRIYKRNNNTLIDIDINTQTNNNKRTINKKNIKKYLNLTQLTFQDTIEVFTEHTELLYENDDYVIVEYKKIIQPKDFFPNLKVYSYDNDIEHNETNLIVDIKQINKIKLINESIKFLEIKLNDNFKESYSIKTLLDQIKQQILDHK